MMVSMAKEKNLRSLPSRDFRRNRAYLADHVFALSTGKSEKPTDKISRKAWRSLVQLPTDVLLRTTDYQGSIIEDCIRQSSGWNRACPWDARQSPVMRIPAMDAWDEFEAAVFMASHGWYRQGTSCLRVALEVVAQGSGYAIRNAVADYEAWREAGGRPEWGTSIGRLKRADPPAATNAVWPVLNRLYGYLSDTTHAHSGRSSADYWESNGPIWSPKALVAFWLDYCDTIASCYVLLKLGWPAMVLPKRARVLFASPSERWNECGQLLLNELFA